MFSAWRIKNYSPVTGWVGDTSKGAGLASPWASTGASLAPVILSGESLAGMTGPISMSQALGIPPISRAVMLFTGVLAGQALIAQDAQGNPVEIPWLNSTGTGAISPGLRNAQMFQDVFFYGHTLLQVTRDAAGLVTDAIRLPIDRWSIDSDGYVLVDGENVAQDSVVYIPGLLPFGFLTYAAGTIRHYEALTRIVESRSNNPVPLLAIYIEEDCPLEDDEIEQVVSNWSAARKAKNGAVAVVPKGIRIEVLDGNNDAGPMLTEARNAARLDVANFVNLTAALVDGNNGTSGTYENTLQNQNEFNALSLPLFSLPITQRLSQDDVTPAGVSVAFDSSKFDALPSDARGNHGRAVEVPREIGTTNA